MGLHIHEADSARPHPGGQTIHSVYVCCAVKWILTCGSLETLLCKIRDESNLEFLDYFIPTISSSSGLSSSPGSHSTMLRPGYDLRLLSWLITFLFISITIADDSTCYYPNGLAEETYKKCPGDSLACCLEGESCLSNGLCFTANYGIIYRGLCADDSWPLAKCPRVCYDGMFFVNYDLCNMCLVILSPALV